MFVLVCSVFDVCEWCDDDLVISLLSFDVLVVDIVCCVGWIDDVVWLLVFV